MNGRIASLGQAVRVLAALLLLALSSAADLSVASTLEDGQRVLYYLTGTAAGKETPLSGYAMSGLKLREVTNGRRLVQAVFKGNTLLECDIVRKGGKKLWKEAKEMLGKHFNSTTGIDSFSVGLAWLDFVTFSRECRRKKKQMSRNKAKQHHVGTDPDRFSTTALKSATTSGSLYRTQPRRHSRYRTQLKTVQLDHMAKGHKHLAKHDIITPGTNWCGPSNRAMRYTDLGGFWEPDKCCRQHDMCAMSILPLEHKYSYSNLRPFTLSHCSCDKSKRAVFTIAVVSLAWVLTFNLQYTDAQVTFSRDWNAGKRSTSMQECSIPLRTATSVCQMLINEIRAITNCELKSLLTARGDDESSSDAFFPSRAG